MAEAIANFGEAHPGSGKIRSFLKRWVAPVGRFLLPRKKKKKASSRRRPGRGKATSSDQTQNHDDQAPSAWPPQRLNVTNKLWGDGCTSPSSAEFLRVTVPLLGLSEEKSLLMLGAGLGGIGRAMVDETGVWVTGYEADRELADLGKDLTKMAGMQKRAPISWADLEQVKLKDKAFNTVISMESLYRVAAKEQLYTAMVAALRGDGELLMTDFVIAGDDPASEVIRTWSKGEPAPPHLWKASAIQSFLKTLNMDVRPAEDVTAQYRAGIFKGFFRYLSNVTKPELLEISGDLIGECGYWAGQLAAIDSGELKVFRFHAFKLPEKRKSVF